MLLIAALCAVYVSAIVLYASATDVVLSREKVLRGDDKQTRPVYASNRRLAKSAPASTDGRDLQRLAPVRHARGAPIETSRVTTPAGCNG